MAEGGDFVVDEFVRCVLVWTGGCLRRSPRPVVVRDLDRFSFEAAEMSGSIFAF
ncbi:hypothetical protein IVB38_34685 [Bradyrhizobium sp. 38]|uniref:hypothetical protein n=1 Tax=unclassified Bradyrhizobium TaxID=2631580 RepID=UPI001FF9754F|nr:MULTISPECIES: hypothetical protein [unclassified Bradyrhizobium]MCK1341028.1 hypothetical protein [Bradyrhizobium sp. 38]MCK1780963.1 hypothetical protein [Bradyrhizobium sp. 132]